MPRRLSACARGARLCSDCPRINAGIVFAVHGDDGGDLRGREFARRVVFYCVHEFMRRTVLGTLEVHGGATRLGPGLGSCRLPVETSAAAAAGRGVRATGVAEQDVLSATTNRRRLLSLPELHDTRGSGAGRRQLETHHAASSARYDIVTSGCA